MTKHIALITLYAVVGLLNLGAFFFDGYDFDKLIIGLLFVALIFQEIADIYREKTDVLIDELLTYYGGKR